ncbi:hypothetical protein Leryth_012920, partial [Lithospermum erythrorhizon]
MNQMEAGNGKPEGNNGDSMYTSVAEGKSRLLKLLLAQVIHLLLVAVFLSMSSPVKNDIAYVPGIFAVILGLISLILGEFGRNWSRISFLKVFLIDSTLSSMISLAVIACHIYLQKVQFTSASVQ